MSLCFLENVTHQLAPTNLPVGTSAATANRLALPQVH